MISTLWKPRRTLRAQVSSALAAVLLAALASCSDGVQVATDATSNPSTTTSNPSTSSPTTSNPVVSIPTSSPNGTGIIPLNDDTRRAARFLTQATFGPTQAEIEALAADTSNAGLQAWLDAQYAAPVSLTLPYTLENSNGSRREPRHDIWWLNAMSGPDQLRQRVAFALSQIFVVSDLDFALGNAQYGMSDYYDMLINNAFGNYRDLLEDVTLHPVMGVYLSMVRNEKANPAENIRPDENYAREVLQLFSIGLFQLDSSGQPTPANNPAPAYSQEIIEEYARVFTGWNYPNSRSWTDTRITNDNYLSAMVPEETFHDTGSKTLLSGVVLPAGQSTAKDMADALDSIFNHPNVGPFIGRQLIQRLVTSNPSPAYVSRVAAVFNNNGNGVRGDLRAVVNAILMDDEARNGQLNNPDFGKVREPVLKLSHFFRALNGTPGQLADGIHRTADFSMDRIDEATGQAVMSSPSVFNFYLPDNPLNTGAGLQSPENQIMTETNIGATHNNYHHQVYRFHNRADLSDDNPRVTIIDLEPLAAMARSSDDVMDWIDLVFFSGAMPTDVREVIKQHLNTISIASSDGLFGRAQDALFLSITSPASNFQH